MAEPQKKSYLVLSPVRVDGKVVKPDGKRTVQLDTDTAREIVALKAVRVASEPKAPA